MAKYDKEYLKLSENELAEYFPAERIKDKTL